MKRIFAWMTDTASCFLYRIYWPLTHLDKSKFQVSWGAPGPDIFDYDVVIGQRIAGDSELWRDLCRSRTVTTVYDMDDDLLNVDPENSLPYSIYHPQVEGTLHNIQHADWVTVSSPYLADLVGDECDNPDVRVLPNCLPQSWMQYREPPHPPVLGWIGSPFHKQDFDHTNVMEAVLRIKDMGPWIDIHTIGGDYLTNVPRRHDGWTTLERAHQLLDFSVGLAPLMNSKFNWSKSHAKALECASKGIPLVAPAIGQYGLFIDHGKNGLLVPPDATTDQWVDTIIEALDPDTNKRLGYEAYQTVLNFTIERNIHLWESIYAS